MKNHYSFTSSSQLSIILLLVLLEEMITRVGAVTYTQLHLLLVSLYRWSSARWKKVVNYWEPFQDLYKQLKTTIKYVFDKKNKCFKDYNDVLRKTGKLVIMVSLPNSTRVSVALILLQDLRSLHSFRYYALKCEKFEALCLNRIVQWK